MSANVGSSGDEVALVQIEIPEFPAVTAVPQSAPQHASSPPKGQNFGGLRAQRARNPDEKPAEYALHILFTQFVRYTERKLSTLGTLRELREFSVEEVLGRGVDSEFDKILESLGHVARRKPKPVIDSVMYWRKSKSDQAAAAQSPAEQTIAEQKSLVSIFILSRVLMEVVRQTPPDVLGEELSEKLEDIVFRQLVSAEPRTIAVNSIRRANHKLLSQLLGDMSRFRFASVDDRFISELEKVPTTLTRAQEAKTSMLIQSMQHLKLKLYPEDYLEESANFLESIAKFYEKTTSIALRNCYSDVLSSMFESIAEVATVEVNHPVWANTIEIFHNQAVQTMKRSWEPSFQLAVMTLCVSPQSVFATNWLPLVEKEWAKLKGKWSPKFSNILVGISRLVWVFGYRCTEGLNSTTRKLESVRKLLLNFNKKHWASLSPPAVRSCVSTLCSSFYAYQQFALDELMFPMLVGNNATHMARSPYIQADAIALERSIIAVLAFSQALYNLRSNEIPSFPSSQLLQTPIRPLAISAKTDQSAGAAVKGIPPSLQHSIDLFGECLGQILMMLSQQIEAADEPLSRQNSVTQFVNPTQPVVRSEASVKLAEAIVRSFPLWAEDNSKYWELLSKQVQSSSTAISTAAIESLRTLARTADVLTLTNIYARSLFALDAQIFSNYELPRSLELEPSLRLYVELIEIWVARLQRGDSGFSNKGKDINVSTLWSVVEEIEGNGLFFLCSQDRDVRALSLRILWLTAELEKAIDRFAGTPSSGLSSRVIDFLEEAEVTELVKKAVPRLELSMPERTRVSKFRSRRGTSVARLADSDYGVDSAIWFKLFPLVISLCFDKYPMPVAICRNIVSTRLVQMHDVLVIAVESEAERMHPGASKHPMRLHSEIVVEQWRLYLMVACITLTTTEEQKLHVPTNIQSLGHGRKKSSQKITLHHQRITSARSIFKIIIPLMGYGHAGIREAIISGISCININTYRTMLECFQPVLQKWEIVLLKGRFPHAAASSSYTTAQRAVTEITTILKHTSHYLKRKEISDDSWIRSEVLSVLELLYAILVSEHIQTDYNFQMLRRYTCGFMEDVMESVGLKFLNEQHQAKYFTLVEGWSSFGQHAAAVAEREAYMRRTSLAAAKDAQEQNVVLATIEFEKRKFDIATSKAMAALLAMPLPAASIGPILKWVYALASSSLETLHESARSALANLLLHNPKKPEIMREIVIRSLNNSDKQRDVGRHYFLSVADVLLDRDPELGLEDPLELIVVAIFKVGSQDVMIRERALELLRLLETRIYGGTSIDSYQYKVRSTTATVVKREIFHLSSEIAKSRTDATYAIFSHLTRAFRSVSENDRRDLISAILPWLKNIEFSPPQGALPSATFESSTFDPEAIMVLSNLFELTYLFSEKFQHEIEALWVGLCTGSSGAKNVKVLLDFLLGICLVNRNPGTVIFVRRILAYLAGSVAEPEVVSRMLQHLEPRWMISQGSKGIDMEQARKKFAYVADVAGFASATERALGGASSTITNLPPLSYSHLSVILLMDVSSSKEALAPHLPTLLHVCLSLADHFIPIVQDSAIELLTMLVSMFSDSSSADITGFRKLLNGSSALRWYYDDMNSSARSSGNITTPSNMVKVIRATAELLARCFGNIERDWASESIKWATTCPVRHVACRSFQIFRCLRFTIDQHELADMLARLSTTISEGSSDIQGFAIQILMTLNAVADSLDSATLAQFPQLYWTALAALGTTKEREYIETLSFALKLLRKYNFHSEEAVALLRSSFPSRWEGEVPSLQCRVLMGLRSANAYDLSLEAIRALTTLPSNDLLVDEHFLPLALAANLPSFLHAMETKSFDQMLPTAQSLEALLAAQIESDVTQSSFGTLSSLSRVLASFMRGRFWSKQDFLQQFISALSSSFPKSISCVLIMLMGTLSNKTPWVKTETMSILKPLLAQTDFTQDSKLAGLGADIVSPLLRLLQSDYAEQALEVIDEAAAIVAGQMDKHILRMSLGSKQLAKEYEKTATLFGIPEESGWSVSQPAVTAMITRNNVHAVFYTCDRSSAEANDRSIEFEFQGDDEFEYSGYHHSPLNRSDSISTSQGTFGNMDRMLTVLDDLDTFFTKAVNPRRGGTNQNTHGRQNSNMTESSTGESFLNDRNESISIPQLYDKKVSLILNRSLERTPSTVSFRTSFADPFFPERTRPAASSNLSISHGDEENFGSFVQPQASRSSSASGATNDSALAGNTTDSDSLGMSGGKPKLTKSEPHESAFRLESLLRGKRRAKKTEQERRQKSSGPPAFQFP